MSEFSPISIYLVISLLVSLIPLGLPFFRNYKIAPYEFTMEKVLFVLRSLKEKLVINLESLLLHGNEDFQEQILKREEKRRRSNNKAHMARKGNPISVRQKSRVILIRFFFLLFVFTVCYSFCLVLGLDFSLILEKLKSMLLLRSFRLLFSRLLGWEVPLTLLLFLCIVAGLGGSTLHMLGSESASGPSRSTSWTEDSFEIGVFLEPFSETAEMEGTGTSVNQPEAERVPPANPVAAPEGAASPPREGPHPHEPHPDPDEVIGGDSVQSIKNRILAKYDLPSIEEEERALYEAEDLFEVKAEIIRLMAPLDPEGDWERRGARALDNPRTLTGEESYERLCRIRESLSNEGIKSQSFWDLKNKVFLRRENLDAESQA